MLIDFPGGQGPLPVGGHHLHDLGPQTVRCHRRLPPVRCLCNGPIASGGIINDAGPVDAASRDGFLGRGLVHLLLYHITRISMHHAAKAPVYAIGEDCSCRDFPCKDAAGLDIRSDLAGLTCRALPTLSRFVINTFIALRSQECAR